MLRNRVYYVVFFCLLTAGCSESTESLITKLRDKNPGIQRQAAEELGKRGDPQSVEPLLNLVKEIENEVRSESYDPTRRFVQTAAIRSLANLGPTAMEGLVNILRQDKDLHPFAKSDIFSALVKFGAPAVDPLADIMNRGETLTRRDAAKALGEINDPRARTELRRVLNDPEPIQRMVVEEALVSSLSKFGSSENVAELAEIMRETEASHLQRRLALELAKMNQGHILIEVMNTPLETDSVTGSYKLTRELSLVEAAARALGRMQDDTTLEALKVFVQNSRDHLRAVAASSLARRGVVEPVLEIIASQDKAGMTSVGAELVDATNPESLKILDDALATGINCIIAGAHVYYIKRGEAGTEDRLITALSSCGGIDMAKSFQESGNQKLAEAGREKESSYYSDRITVWVPAPVLPGGNAEMKWGADRR